MRRSWIAPIAIFATVVASCGGDDEAGMREGRASGMLADSAVLAAMRDTVTVNRIIYDPAPDLSLSSAQQRRPDIFRPPTPAPAAPARGQGSGVRSQGR
ncbi:MAG TPA: hypothetical protein VJ650_03000 [Gemmatimonadaceae bacterium]|nr:hypothetical protein [Gemmatimonadaceae bacterium]